MFDLDEICAEILLDVAVLFSMVYRAQKKLEFQLVLWASSSLILLTWGHFLLVLFNDLVKR